MKTSDTDNKKLNQQSTAKALLERSIREIKNLKQKLKEHDLKIKELDLKIVELELGKNGPIAIVGIGCRYPGGIIDPDSFWESLKEAKNGITELSNERWDMDVFYDPKPQTPGKMYTKAAGIIDDPEYFDADFFGISPREAETMDPQHRLLLETAYEAMENAGYASASLSGTRTGVFIGIASSDYAHLASRFGEPEQIEPWNGTGNAFSAAAGRISYLYNLKGPSIAVDTACSSSLVALHYACQSLRSHESDCALVGGVSLLLNPGASIIFSGAGMLSKSGACRTFSDDADGYVRSEGAGMVMIKRLADAEKAGDNILAVIRGSAVNQDGKSQGLTAPNETAQIDVINAALIDANIKSEEVGYIEAHGTGTPLGDPIEIAAIQHSYGRNRDAPPLVVGTVKTNLGHTEAAAGVAGLIKLTLALKKGQIPAQLHFKQPNSHIDWQDGSIVIPTELTHWPLSAKLQTQPDTRKGGLSSFGFTGTNAHIILESYPRIPDHKSTPEEYSQDIISQDFISQDKDNHQLVALSAKTPKALDELVDRYQLLMGKTMGETDEPTDLELLSYSTLVGRDHHKYRLTFTVDSDQQWRDYINRYNQHESTPHFEGHKTKSALKIAFLFPGQGSQYQGMGKGLYQRFSAFREIIEYCELQLAELCDISLKNLLWGDESSQLNQTHYT
ncbi:MAG: type I polyketide synthase, partial [Pseudomonadales bacterium]|nr:type I polyketide synthase [Pseudomonadales bacterium]